MPFFYANIVRFSVTDVSDSALNSLKDVPDKRQWPDDANPKTKVNPPGIPPPDWSPPSPVPMGDEDWDLAGNGRDPKDARKL